METVATFGLSMVIGMRSFLYAFFRAPFLDSARKARRRQRKSAAHQESLKLRHEKNLLSKQKFHEYLKEIQERIDIAIENGESSINLPDGPFIGWWADFNDHDVLIAKGFRVSHSYGSRWILSW